MLEKLLFFLEKKKFMKLRIFSIESVDKFVRKMTQFFYCS